MSKILEQLEDIAQTQPDNGNDKSNLTDEQVKTVEASMKQLSVLSKSYKEQKAELGVESEDEEDEIENDSELISPITTPETSDNEEKEEKHFPNYDEVIKKEPSPSVIDSDYKQNGNNIKNENEAKHDIKKESREEEDRVQKGQNGKIAETKAKVRRRARRD